MSAWRRLGGSTTALIAITVVLYTVFGAILGALAVTERENDRTEAREHAAHGAMAVASFVRESWLRNDFQNIQTIVSDWGRQNDTVAALIVTAPNGFVVASYRRDAAATLAATARREVRHDGRALGSVALTEDIAPLLASRAQARFRLVPGVVLFIAALSLMLWWVVRRLVLLPMERIDAELGATAAKLAARNRELRAALMRAEESNRAKSQFLAAMSHELRTPLNAVIGFSDMMRHETMGRLGSERYRDYAASINDSGRHLLELINDVLDVAKIESGSMELHREDVTLDKPVHAAVRMVRDQAVERGLYLNVDLPDPVPVVFVDERRAKQILLNLLSNAVKFTDPGGRVDVTVEVAADGVVIRVADTGIGMSAADIGTALSAFGQADSDLNRRYSGTGLGLPLARDLTEMHGGSLLIDSTPGDGTTVEVFLPADCVRGSAPLAAPPVSVGAST